MVGVKVGIEPLAGDFDLFLKFFESPQVAQAGVAESRTCVVFHEGGWGGVLFKLFLLVGFVFHSFSVELSVGAFEEFVVFEVGSAEFGVAFFHGIPREVVTTL